jgi:threonine/homoserine/homoserine lactone efflux protein
MTDSVQLLPYFLVTFLGAMSPGPDFAIVTRSAALGGRGPGLAAATGIAAGLAVNSFAAVAGMGAVIAASPKIYLAIRIIGAAYLVYIGVLSLLSLRTPAETSTAAPATADADAGTEEQQVQPKEQPKEVVLTAGATFRQGFLTNLLNPKAVIFLVTLMPQFLPDEPTLVQRLLLGGDTVFAAFCWFALVATAVSTFRKAFQRPGVRKAVNGVTGVVLILVGARIASLA